MRADDVKQAEIKITADVKTADEVKPAAAPGKPIAAAAPVAAAPAAAPDNKSADKPGDKPADKPAAKPADAPAPTPGPATPRVDSGDPEALKLHLMDGSVITGRLSLKELQVETKFGMLNVPVANIRSFTPGLTSHPTLAKQIAGWIDDLGSGTFNDREAAQQALTKLGSSIRAELDRRRDDADAERRTRVRAILADFEQAQDDADDLGDKSPNSSSLIQDDTVATSEFTIVGRVVPQSFAVNSLYGPLTIKLADIRRVEREGQKKEELPTNFAVTSAHMVHNGTLSTGIRLERGDSVTVSASGQMIMSPWGNQAVTSPDGAANYGWFINNRIPVGALIGRVGNGDEWFMVGSKNTFTAKKAGVLQLAMAMRADMVNNGNEFPGKYNIKIKVVRKQ